MGNMDKDHYYAEMLSMMREQGGKDNPTTLQIGVMQSENSVKINDLILNAEDLYIADHLVAGYTRELETPYLSDVKLNVTHGEYDVKNVQAELTEEPKIVFIDGLKAGDIVAVQKLNDNNMYVILARVVSA